MSPRHTYDHLDLANASAETTGLLLSGALDLGLEAGLCIAARGAWMVYAEITSTLESTTLNMKIVTEEELAEFSKATRIGGFKGLALGLGTSVPVSLLLQRYSPRYRTIPLPLKAFGVVMLTSATTVIWAERAGIAYDRERYSQSLYGREELERLKEKREIEGKRWGALGGDERFKETLLDHKYSVIVGGWATTMAGAWAYISRDKYMTFSQKIVQVRMWAQGATIAMIIGTAIISQAERTQLREHKPVDHSWMTQINEKPEQSLVQKVTTS